MPQARPTEAAEAPRPPAGPERLILAFGDSLYAGYGLKPDEAYPSQLQTALWAKGINARVVNSGVSGDTTAAGRQRLAFALDNLPRVPDLALVGLGGNDMLRGLPPAEARANLAAILDELDRRKVPVLLTGMLAAPNLGEDYARAFNAIYPELARKHRAALVPFFLQAVIDDPTLQQADHVHPTAPGVARIVAATVDAVAGALPPLSPRASPPPR
ncbi:MAG: arylesterase [Novosphingobium sp.]